MFEASSVILRCIATNISMEQNVHSALNAFEFSCFLLSTHFFFFLLQWQTFPAIMTPLFEDVCEDQPE